MANLKNPPNVKRLHYNKHQEIVVKRSKVEHKAAPHLLRRISIISETLLPTIKRSESLEHRFHTKLFDAEDLLTKLKDCIKENFLFF